MARIRTIKPDFFTSLTIADLTQEARLTFIGLWTHVDDEGRCVDDARLVKAAVWPLDERTAKDIDVDLWEISDAGLVLRYTVGAKKFIAVTGWKEHQRINRPTPSKFPAPEKGEQTPKGRLTEPSVRAHGGLSESSRELHPGSGEGSFTPTPAPEMSESAEEPNPDPLPYPGAVVLPMFTSENVTPECAHGGLSESSLTAHWGKGTGNREQGKDLYSASALSSPKDEGPTDPPPSFDGYEDTRFQMFWDRYPHKVSKKKAVTAFEKALKRTSFDALMAGLNRYLTEDRRALDGYVKDPTTWLNGDCWDDEPVRRAGGNTNIVGGSREEVPDHEYWANLSDEDLRNIL